LSVRYAGEYRAVMAIIAANNIVDSFGDKYRHCRVFSFITEEISPSHNPVPMVNEIHR